MKNDLWYLGNGFWVAYTEDPEIISEFKNMKDMQLSATYYHIRKGGVRAAQFSFHQGNELSRGGCLLSYVCLRLLLDFSKALTLYRNNDRTPYLDRYPAGPIQLELFPEDLKKVGKRKRKSV